MSDYDYDYIIVGAGLAGLHCALHLSYKYPRARIAVAEEYNYVGGRVVTYHPNAFPQVHWENGAGRIHASHARIAKYIQKYHLTPVPLKATPNIWPSLSHIITTALASASPNVLATHTLRQLIKPAILDQFAYRAEVGTLRADLALESLKHEMGSMEDFYVVKEGLGEIPHAMKKELEERGTEFLMRHRLLRLSRDQSATFPSASFPSASFRVNRRTTRIIRAKKIILAIHSDALSKILTLTPLKHLRMEPLLRTYAIFPAPGGKSWFSQMSTTVTPNSPLHFVIPINPSKGIIMTSYTDAEDARYWFKILEKGEDVLQAAIMKELRITFPQYTIPDPIFFKAHPWYQGCTYWLPGNYSPAEMSKKIMNPLPNVYVCGESYSVDKQCWIEGALENADAMLELLDSK